MKLSAENKINVKNAFHLQLIDYMTEMMRKKASDLDNFQAASCALDASAKIYAYRQALFLSGFSGISGHALTMSQIVHGCSQIFRVSEGTSF